MSQIRLTCDRLGDLVRVAVWQGKVLRDLYVNRSHDPDLSGAIVCAKIVRVLPGGKGGWAEAGLAARLYFETTENVCTGAVHAFRILSTIGEGKAWPSVLLTDDGEASAVGLIAPPPTPWQAALADLKEIPSSMAFAEKEDYDKAFREQGAETKISLCYEPQNVHPELDDVWPGLFEAEVPLPGGASLLIEPTRALVAIDINAGEKGAPLEINLLALREAARQIRLRALSGLIVIDALKMKNRTDNAKVLRVLSEATSTDPAGVQVFDMTKLGLIELTRKRRGPPLNIWVHEE